MYENVSRSYLVKNKMNLSELGLGTVTSKIKYHYFPFISFPNIYNFYVRMFLKYVLLFQFDYDVLLNIFAIFVSLI